MTFPVSTSGPDRDTGFLELGITGASEGRHFFSSYRFDGSDSFQAHSLNVGMTFEF